MVSVVEYTDEIKRAFILYEYKKTNGHMQTMKKNLDAVTGVGTFSEKEIYIVSESISLGSFSMAKRNFASDSLSTPKNDGPDTVGVSTEAEDSEVRRRQIAIRILSSPANLEMIVFNDFASGRSEKEGWGAHETAYNKVGLAEFEYSKIFRTFASSSQHQNLSEPNEKADENKIAPEKLKDLKIEPEMPEVESILAQQRKQIEARQH